jgi:hypothetical protein
MSIGNNYFAANFGQLDNPIATVPLNPNSSNYSTSVGMTALLQALGASTEEFEAAAYNPQIQSSPYSSFMDAPQSYEPQFPSYSPEGLNNDPFYGSLGSSGFGGLGETNPYFNAGYSGGLGGFFGGSSGLEGGNSGFEGGNSGFGGGFQGIQGDPGTWTESVTDGCNGQPTSINFTFKANPQSCEPKPTCETNSCNSCSAKPAPAPVCPPAQPTPPPPQASNGCG